MADSTLPKNIVTYLFYNFKTGELLAELPLTEVTFQKTLNGSGQFQGKLHIEDPRIQQINWRDATSPAQSLVFVDINGSLVWGGIIWARQYDSQTKQYTLTGNEFWSYFEHRSQAADYSYTWMQPEDPMIIAQRIVTDALAVPGSAFQNIPISFNVDTSGVILPIANISTTSNSFTVTIGGTQTIPAQSVVRIEVQNCTNPTNGTYTAAVNTVQGTVGTSIQYGIGSGIGSYSQSPIYINLENQNIYATNSSYAAGQSGILYVIGFTTAVPLTPGDTIEVTTIPVGTIFSTNLADYQLQFGGTSLQSWVVMSYPIIERQTVQMIVSQLQQMGYGIGFDYATDVAYNSSGVPEITLSFSFPRRGRVASASGLTLDLHNAIRFTIQEDGTKAANFIYETSTSSGSVVVELGNSQAQQEYVLLEDVISHPNINSTPNVHIVLEAVALGDLAINSYPASLPEVTLVFEKDIKLSDFIIGDDILVVYDNTAQSTITNLPVFDGPLFFYYRIIEADIKIAEEGVSTLKLSLDVPPWTTAIKPPL